MSLMDESLATQLIDQIFAVNGGLLKAGDQLAQPYGLTAAQWQVLGFLSEHPTSAAEVARRRGLKRQSVQETVNRLLAAGMLERLPNPNDARAPLLMPTLDALEALRKLEEDRDKWLEKIMSHLSSAELGQTLVTLQKMRLALGIPNRNES